MGVKLKKKKSITIIIYRHDKNHRNVHKNENFRRGSVKLYVDTIIISFKSAVDTISPTQCTSDFDTSEQFKNMSHKRPGSTRRRMLNRTYIIPKKQTHADDGYSIMAVIRFRFFSSQNLTE